MNMEIVKQKWKFLRQWNIKRDMHTNARNVILGIDPGTQVTGFGIIEIKTGKQIPLSFGCIRPSSKLEAPERFLHIFNGIEELLQQYQPTSIAVETQFVYKNIHAALKLGMARGMVLLAAAKKKIPIFEYAPRKAKLAVVGNGSASKEQVQKMIRLLLELKELPEPEDAADALALALCHAHAQQRMHYV
jgi:crossover junction endodeoxyribonuclease RuvC